MNMVYVGHASCPATHVIELDECGRIEAVRAIDDGPLPQCQPWYPIVGGAGYSGPLAGAGWHLVQLPRRRRSAEGRTHEWVLRPPGGVRREKLRGSHVAGETWYGAWGTGRGSDAEIMYIVFCSPDLASDHELLAAMRGDYEQDEEARVAAAIEWRRRYPVPGSGTGWKPWKAEGDRLATSNQ